MPRPPSPAELSKRYGVFWENERFAFARNLRDPTLVAAAIQDMADEALSQTPMQRMDIRMALARAALNKMRWSESALRKRLADAARRGGQARRRCALNDRLTALIRVAPRMAYIEVIYVLRRDGSFAIEAEDDFITYQARDGSLKRVSHAAIRNRLTRIRKTLSAGR